MSFSGMTYLDNVPYVERRAQAADEAEARLDAVSAQAARRHLAIEVAARRLRGVAQVVAEGQLDRPAVLELLAEIAAGLEEANRVRATDPKQTEVESEAPERERSLSRAAGHE